jgi:two-component sensor histidine kinase
VRGTPAGRSSRAASPAPLGLAKVTFSLSPAMSRLHVRSWRGQKKVSQSALQPKFAVLQKRCHPPHKCCFPREYAQLATPVSDQSTASGLALQRAWSSTRSRASHLNCSSATIRARFSPGRAGPRGARRGSETRFEDGTSRYLFGHATPLRDAQGNACGAVAAFVDITDRKHAEEQRDLLIAELNHRVKNTLASVISIARQSFSLNPNVAEARSSFDARIRALAQTHSRLAEANWSGVSLEAMLLGELGPYLRKAAAMCGCPVHR